MADRIAELIDRIQADATELQQLYVSPEPPEPPMGDPIYVTAGQDLQAVLDQVDESVEIHLERGVTFEGNFILRNRVDSGTVTLRTAGDLPVPDPATRPWISPTDAAPFAKLKARDTQSPALFTADGAHDYTIDSLDFLPNTQHPDRTYLEIGRGDMTSLDQVPSRITIDRCYLHGDPAIGSRRAIALQAADGAVFRSYIHHFYHWQDAQAIATWCGPGPFHIEGNYLESSGENYISGGADTQIIGLIPSDLLFRSNLCIKPLGWQSEPDACVKNLFELKAMCRARVTGNAFENCWTSGQTGNGVVLTARNQDGSNPWNCVSDVEFDHNAIGYCTGFAFNLLGLDDLHPSAASFNLNIHDNISWSCQNGILFNTPFVPTRIVHNTFIWLLWKSLAFSATAHQPPGSLTVTDNVFGSTTYGIVGDNRAPGTDTLNYYAPGATYVSNVQEQPPYIPYPEGQSYVPAGQCGADNLWTDPPTPYPLGSDGKPCGADMPTLRSLLSWYTPAAGQSQYASRPHRC